jgi:hypothetical protein
VSSRKARRKARKRRSREGRLRVRRTRHALRRAAHRRRVRWWPWWLRFPLELLVLRQHFPAEYGTWVGERIGRALVLKGELDVPTLPKRRRVAICFPGPPSRVRPVVMVSGPRRVRHRFRTYRPTSLCLYYGRDPAAMKWQLDDGLGALLDVTRQHLFKEEWWAATRRWPGAEVHIDPPLHPGSRPRSLRPRARRERERQTCWCGGGHYKHCHGAIPEHEELAALGLAEGAAVTSEDAPSPVQ